MLRSGPQLAADGLLWGGSATAGGALEEVLGDLRSVGQLDNFSPHGGNLGLEFDSGHDGASCWLAESHNLNSSEVLASMATAYPEVSAAAILVLGLILARVAEGLSQRGVVLLNRLLARFAGDRADLISESAGRALARVMFWLVTLVALLLALRTLGMGRVFIWLDVPLGYLPRIVIGLVIIGAAHLLGIFARLLLTRLRGETAEGALLPRTAQTVVLIIGLMTGLQHMGLDVSFIGQLLILLLAAGLGGLALAFAIGARRYVANLVAHAIVARYSPGDVIRIHDIEGVVIEIHRTGVDISTEEGVVTLPAAMFAEQPVLRRHASDGVSS